MNCRKHTSCADISFFQVLSGVDLSKLAPVPCSAMQTVVLTFLPVSPWRELHLACCCTTETLETGLTTGAALAACLFVFELNALVVEVLNARKEDIVHGKRDAADEGLQPFVWQQ
jgi:hypothetical protein